MDRTLRFLRIGLAAATLMAPVAALADPQVIRLNSPTHGDQILARAFRDGHGPPASGLWTLASVKVDPNTGATTTTTIVANHPFFDVKHKRR